MSVDVNVVVERLAARIAQLEIELAVALAGQAVSDDDA